MTPTIETQRLKLLPLTPEQLIKYCQTDNALETELGLNPTTRSIGDELREALQNTLLLTVADPSKNYLFSTLWTLIAKEQNMMVGDLCFKGEPNENGEIEIGYGTYGNFQNQGYMTEAVAGVVAWAFTQKGVEAVIAETEKDNIPSHKILEKNKFVACQEIDNRIWWKLVRNRKLS